MTDRPIQTNLRVLKSLAIGALLFLSSGTFAATTLISASGHSGQDLSTGQKPIIYAGFTSGCTGDGTSTCDSCTGTPSGTPVSSLWTCNKRNAYPNLKLIIQTSTPGSTTTSTPFVRIGDTAFTPQFQQVLDGDGVLTTQIAWSEICAHMQKGSDCSGGSFATDMSVGFETGDSTRDGVSIRLVARVAATDQSDWFYTDCNTAGATGNIGFCHFEAYPGDGKLYADNLVVAQGYPASPAPGSEYTNVVFFYEAQQTGETDTATIGRITNASSYFEVGVNRSADPPVADNRIDGLSNGRRYCLVMANQDATGVISYFTPVPGTPGSPVTEAELCATPSEVIGLLDDKHCFIATAAYGSQMAEEVSAFRAFRNEFLLTNAIGTAFVKKYYEWGPAAAEFISQSEFLRAGVRMALWPVWLFVQLSMRFGLIVALLSVVGVSVLAWTTWMRVLRRSEG